MQDSVSQLNNFVWGTLSKIASVVPRSEKETVIVKEIQTAVAPMYGRNFIRVAGLSGASSIVLAAYGAHKFAESKDHDENQKRAYETGSRYHLIHSAALLAMPMCRRPWLTGTLLSSGILLFCGGCYGFAFTGNTTVRKITPYGGMLLIAAWLSLII